MQSLAADIEAFESMSEGERFDAEERAMLEHRRSTASYIDRQLAAGTGLQEKVITTQFDDGDWATVELPKPWSQTDPALRGFDGAVWYRRTIDVPEDVEGAEPPPGARSHRRQRHRLVRRGAHRIDGRGPRPDAEVPGEGADREARSADDHGALHRFGRRRRVGGERHEDRRDRSPGGEPRIDRPRRTVEMGEERSPPGSPPASRPEHAAPGTRHTDYAALNNAMIQPFVPFGVRGAIWYQGESNAGEPVRYAEFMPMLVADWAADFERTEMPFGIVQLAAFKPFKADQPVEDDWPRLREAQSRTAADLDHVGIVVTTDIGDAADIHPRNKREVGRRLADWALADHYGRPNDRNASPRVIEASTTAAEPGVVRLVVEHAAGELTTRGGGVPDGFALQGPSGRWHWAEAAFGRTGGRSSFEATWSRGRWRSPMRGRTTPNANVTGSSGLPLDQARIRLD